MQIDTKKTVNQTFEQYRWDDLGNWNAGDTVLTRHIWHDKNLTVYQQIRRDNYQIVYETPEYTLRLSKGLHDDLTSPQEKRQTPYYAINVETTLGERKLYSSLIDDAGYQDIKGNRQYVLDFEKILPPKYFSLVKNEDAPHISTYWVKRGCKNLTQRKLFSDKERS